MQLITPSLASIYKRNPKWKRESEFQHSNICRDQERMGEGKNSDPGPWWLTDLSYMQEQLSPSTRAWGMLSEHSPAESHLSLLFTLRVTLNFSFSCFTLLNGVYILSQSLKELLSIKPHKTKRTFLYNERVLTKEEGVSLYPSWYPQYYERLTEESKHDEGCKEEATSTSPRPLESANRFWFSNNHQY